MSFFILILLFLASINLAKNKECFYKKGKLFCKHKELIFLDEKAPPLL
jgi:hypothetical protein